MYFIIILFSIYAFIQTVAYGIFEYKKNSNKIVGIFICIFGVLSLILPNILILI